MYFNTSIEKERVSISRTPLLLTGGERRKNSFALAPLSGRRSLIDWNHRTLLGNVRRFYTPYPQGGFELARLEKQLVFMVFTSVGCLRK